MKEGVLSGTGDVSIQVAATVHTAKEQDFCGGVGKPKPCILSLPHPPLIPEAELNCVPGASDSSAGSSSPYLALVFLAVQGHS